MAGGLRGALGLSGAMALTLLAAACTTPLEQPSQSPEPVRHPERLRDPWSEPLQDASLDCVELARAVLRRDGPHADLALRRIAGAASVDNDLGLDEAGAPVRCVLYVDAPLLQPAPQRKLLSREPVHSSYADGTERVANPEHVELRKALGRAERGRGTDAGVLATGAPMLDLIGSLAELAVAGVDKLMRMQEEGSLRRKLADTPPEIERERTRRYSYAAARIEARRRASVRIGLQDRNAGTMRETTATILDTAVFRLDEGRRPTDLGSPVDGQPSSDLATVAAWERARPPIRVSDLLAQIVGAGVEREQTGDQLLARWSAPPEPPSSRPKAPHAASASLVHVAGHVLEGVGFYVEPGHVLTLDRLVHGSDLAKVTGSDGRSSFALVERRDRKRGLALLKVSLQAPALSLADAPPDQAEVTLAWPDGPAGGARGVLARDQETAGLVWQPELPVRPPAGTPMLAEERVTAMVDDIGDLGATLLPAAELRAFLAAGG